MVRCIAMSCCAAKVFSNNEDGRGRLRHRRAGRRPTDGLVLRQISKGVLLRRLCRIGYPSTFRIDEEPFELLEFRLCSNWLIGLEDELLELESRL